jgi:hypothetical protein
MIASPEIRYASQDIHHCCLELMGKPNVFNGEAKTIVGLLDVYKRLHHAIACLAEAGGPDWQYCLVDPFYLETRNGARAIASFVINKLESYASENGFDANTSLPL